MRKNPLSLYGMPIICAYKSFLALIELHFPYAFLNIDFSKHDPSFHLNIRLITYGIRGIIYIKNFSLYNVYSYMWCQNKFYIVLL